MKRWLTISFLIFAHVKGHAQPSCFARIEMDRHSVYVQQPFKITITVLTATWYTQPLDFDNIQIPNAFVLPFDQTQPGMFDIGSKKYAGLTFYFVVFPYKAGSFTVPSINIVATTPAEGTSESKKITISTALQHFTVKPVPESMADENWFVAKNVSVSERWSKPLHNLKVGDVVERFITIDAKGTLPQFIPALQKEDLDFASDYLQDAELRDERNEYDANGRLTQSIIYLFEKEGDVEIPAIPVKWWNPNTRRMYSRNIAGAKINIKPNPNLGIVATMKDSLAATRAVVAAPKPEKHTRTFFGIAWYWALLVAVILLYILYHLVKWSIGLWKRYVEKRKKYLGSEAYAFKQFLRAPLALTAFTPALYRWWDSVKIRNKSSALSTQLEQAKQPEMEAKLSAYFQQAYQAENPSAQVDAQFKKDIKSFRNKAIKQEELSAKSLVSPFQELHQE